MKRALIALALATSVALAGCAGPLKANGVEYKPYGIVNQDAEKQSNVKYEISAGSVIVAILFSETIVFPVYIIGWDLWKPVAVR